MRNRLYNLGSRNKKLVGEGLTELSKRMGFRCVDGFAERVVYREFFPRGLTAFDDLDETTLGMRPSLSHLTAREELITLRCICRCRRTANGGLPPAPNGIRSWTSRCRSMTLSSSAQIPCEATDSA